MNSKTGFKNSQKGLYNNILPPPPRFCNSIISGVWGDFEFNSSADCNVQSIALQDCERYLAVILTDFGKCKAGYTECVQSPNVILRNLRDVILRVKPEGSYCHPELGSGAEHTSQTAKELLEEGNNNKINYNIHRASGVAALPPEYD